MGIASLRFSFNESAHTFDLFDFYYFFFFPVNLKLFEISGLPNPNSNIRIFLKFSHQLKDLNLTSWKYLIFWTEKWDFFFCKKKDEQWNLIISLDIEIWNPYLSLRMAGGLNRTPFSNNQWIKHKNNTKRKRTCIIYITKCYIEKSDVGVCFLHRLFMIHDFGLSYNWGYQFPNCIIRSTRRKS